jgi:hypothetical protein
MEGSNLISEKLQIKLQFEYTPWLFILDQLIRVVILTVYLQNYISTWLFILIQIALLGLLILRQDRYQKYLRTKYTPYINQKYKELSPEIIYDDQIPEALTTYQAIFGFIFSFWFFFHIINTHNWYMYIFIFILSLLGTTICVLPLFLSIKYKEIAGVISVMPRLEKKFKDSNNQIKLAYQNVSNKYPDTFQSEKVSGYTVIDLDPVDQNDSRIARLESEIKNINHRSEAWMLESVFLGGLAFSGFLTLASANFLGKEPEVFNLFLTHFTQYFNRCSLVSGMSWISEIYNYFFKNDLYIVIMLLCLMTSVFFLLVLTLRWRLNGLSLNMDHLIRILIIFNSNEEELYNMRLENEAQFLQIQRLEKIQSKIETVLIDAEKLLIELRPTSLMMNTYRNIAVFLFYMVLIISGFYFSAVVAFLILSLAVFTQLFRTIETYSKIEKIKNVLKRH